MGPRSHNHNWPNKSSVYTDLPFKIFSLQAVSSTHPALSITFTSFVNISDRNSWKWNYSIKHTFKTFDRICQIAFHRGCPCLHPKTVHKGASFFPCLPALGWAERLCPSERLGAKEALLLRPLMVVVWRTWLLLRKSASKQKLWAGEMADGLACLLLLRGPEFGSLPRGSQQPVTPASGELMPSSDLCQAVQEGVRLDPQ